MKRSTERRSASCAANLSPLAGAKLAPPASIADFGSARLQAAAEPAAITQIDSAAPETDGNTNEDAKRRAGVQSHQRGREGRRRRPLQAQASRAAQRGANTSVPFVPPKPKELERATRIGILRAALGT
jgi:hypothetical protein